MTKIGILFVDDHAIVREGYRSLLSKQPGLAVIAEAVDAQTAYRLYHECHPELVITDISLPGSSGLELIARLKQRYAGVKILVFSMHLNSGFALQALRAGALGYITKSSPPEELLKAIREVHAGKQILSADIAQLLALEKLGGERMALETLTSREFEILRLLVENKTNDAIARILNISPKTVSNCHYIVKRKLGVTNDIELTRLAIKLKVLDL